MRLLQGMPPARLITLAGAARSRPVGRGEFVWIEGEAANTVCFLVSGRLETARVGPGGEQIVVEVVAPGSHTGLPGPFAKRGARATQVRATEDSVVILVPGEAILGFLETSPVILRRVIEELATSAVLMLESWADLVFLDVVGRVARKLLDLAGERGRQTPEGIVVDLAVSQRTLAGMIAASRENTNRALARLSAAGDIKLRGSTVTILDREGLSSRVLVVGPGNDL